MAVLRNVCAAVVMIMLLVIYDVVVLGIASRCGLPRCHDSALANGDSCCVAPH